MILPIRFSLLTVVTALVSLALSASIPRRADVYQDGSSSLEIITPGPGFGIPVPSPYYAGATGDIPLKVHSNDITEGYVQVSVKQGDGKIAVIAEKLPIVDGCVITPITVELDGLNNGYWVLNVTVFDNNGVNHGSVYQDIQLNKPVDAEQHPQEDQSASYTAAAGQYQTESQVVDSQFDDNQVNASQVDESQLDDSQVNDSQNEDSQINTSQLAQATDAEIYSVSDSDPNWDSASLTDDVLTTATTDDDSSTAVAFPAPW